MKAGKRRSPSAFRHEGRRGSPASAAAKQAPREEGNMRGTSRFLLVAAGVLACTSAWAVEVTAPQPWPIHNRRVERSADAGLCRQVGPVYRCRQFAVIESLDTRTNRRETVLHVSYWGSSDGSYYYRNLDCPVDPGVLKLSPNGASVDVVVSPDAPGCVNEGEQVTFEPSNVTPYPFTAPVLVQAEMLDPGRQHSNVSVVTDQDNDMGTTVREQCRGSGGFALRAGEMRIGEVGVSIVIGQFAQPEAEGSYMSYGCGRAEKLPAQ
jgi:hypothetical protein